MKTLTTLFFTLLLTASAPAQTSNYLSAEYVGQSTVQSNLSVGGTLAVTGVTTVPTNSPGSGHAFTWTDLTANAFTDVGTANQISVVTNGTGPYTVTYSFTSSVNMGALTDNSETVSNGISDLGPLTNTVVVFGNSGVLTNLPDGTNGNFATFQSGSPGHLSWVAAVNLAPAFVGSSITSLSAGNISSGTLSTNRYTRTGVLRTLFIGAGAMNPLPTNGVVQSLPTAATNSANTNINRDAWTMSVTQTNGVHFTWFAPPTWNQGTINFRLMVTDTGTNAGTATNYVWSVAAQDVSQAGSLANSLGTAIQATNGIYTNANQLSMVTSAAVTVGGSPAAGDMIDCQIQTLGGNGSFTVTNNSFQILGVILQFQESATEPTTL